MEFEHGYALLVGVGADLPVTVNDAGGMRDILLDPGRCSYRESQVRLLTEGQATRQGILDGLDWLAELVKNDPQATALVYYSGHGWNIPEYHLVPYGWNPQDIAKTAVTGVEFTARLNALQVKKLLVLLDCCHAGGVADVKGPPVEASPLPPQIDEILGRGSGKAVIASSRKYEKSYAGQPYSEFTKALREALAGYGASEADGFAYLTDLALYVGRMVPNRTQGKQNPVLKLAAADNFAIAYYAAGEKSPRPLAESTAAPLLTVTTDVGMLEGYRRILQRYQGNLLAVEERISLFYDQAAVPLDLERNRTDLERKIIEYEDKIRSL